MRKIAAVMCAVFIGAGASAFAQDNQNKKETKLSIWGGYATYNLSQVNDFLNQIAATAPGSSVTKQENGFALGAEALRQVAPRVLVGPRIEYLTANTGKATLPTGAETKVDHSLMPVYVGGRYILKPIRYDSDDMRDKWGLSAGLYAGYAWAWMKTSVKTLAVDTSFNGQGSGFAGEALVGGAYRLTKNLEVGIDIGYRYVPISEMKATEDNATLGVTKDMVEKDLNGRTIEHDFSGLIANIGLLYRI